MIVESYALRCECLFALTGSEKPRPLAALGSAAPFELVLTARERRYEHSREAPSSFSGRIVA